MVELKYTYIPSITHSKFSTVKISLQPLAALMVGLGLILLMVVLIIYVFRIGGLMRENKLKSLGAFRQSYDGVLEESSERGSLLKK